MLRCVSFSLAILTFIQFILGIALSPPSMAQEWAVRGKQQGTLKVVDLFAPSVSVMYNCAEGLSGAGNQKTLKNVASLKELID